MLKKKITELEKTILDISGLATKTALTTVEDKISDVSSLVKKTNYDIKISELKKKLLIITMTSISLLQSSIL